MVRYLIILSLVFCSPLLADEPAPKPTDVKPASDGFPVIPSPTPIKPITPTVATDPDALPVVKYGEIYAVEYDTDFELRAYPSKLVDIVRAAPGPITVRGVIAGGDGKVTTRVFKGPFVAFVDVLEGASGTLTLVRTPLGLTDGTKITEKLITVNSAPRPPPDKPKPDEPPVVDDPVTARVKAALTGHPEDAAKFAAMADELAKALDAGTVPTLRSMETKMQAALTAVGWPVGKYGDMTKLAGELWGAGVADRDLTAADRALFAGQLRTISKACGEVK